MQDLQAKYLSLLSENDGAKRLHIHLTVLDPAGEGWDRMHEHAAEEAVYYLEGETEYTFDGKTQHAKPGDLVFFPANVPHAKVRFLTPVVKYLVIRSVEEGDEPCCCVKAPRGE